MSTPKILGEGIGPLGAAGIRSGDQEVVQLQAFEVRQENRRTIEVVHGHFEEALNLVGVEVHGDDPVDARSGEHVGNQLGANGDAGCVLCGPAAQNRNKGMTATMRLADARLAASTSMSNSIRLSEGGKVLWTITTSLPLHGLLDADPELSVAEDRVLCSAKRSAVVHGNASLPSSMDAEPARMRMGWIVHEGAT